MPAHYLLTGYFTAFSNIVALWIFQGVANLVAIGFAAAVRPGYGVDRHPDDAAEAARPANHGDHLGRPSGAGG